MEEINIERNARTAVRWIHPQTGREMIDIHLYGRETPIDPALYIEYPKRERYSHDRRNGRNNDSEGIEIEERIDGETTC